MRGGRQFWASTDHQRNFGDHVRPPEVIFDQIKKNIFIEIFRFFKHFSRIGHSSWFPNFNFWPREPTKTARIGQPHPMSILKYPRKTPIHISEPVGASAPSFGLTKKSPLRMPTASRSWVVLTWGKINWNYTRLPKGFARLLAKIHPTITIFVSI